MFQTEFQCIKQINTGILYILPLTLCSKSAHQPVKQFRDLLTLVSQSSLFRLNLCCEKWGMLYMWIPHPHLANDYWGNWSLSHLWVHMINAKFKLILSTGNHHERVMQWWFDFIAVASLKLWLYHSSSLQLSIILFIHMPQVHLTIFMFVNYDNKNLRPWCREWNLRSALKQLSILADHRDVNRIIRTDLFPKHFSMFWIVRRLCEHLQITIRL